MADPFTENHTGVPAGLGCCSPCCLDRREDDALDRVPTVRRIVMADAPTTRPHTIPLNRRSPRPARRPPSARPDRVLAARRSGSRLKTVPRLAAITA